MAHHGVDQLTLEARAYAVARQFDPFLVNSVVGFIGPEYLLDGKQIIRAGLEDHFCGKLLGLPMGCDVCYTNHVDADQNDMDVLLTLLGAAGCNFVMGVPGADDVMLDYQSTSFHDAQYLRQVLGLRPAPEFEAWLERMRHHRRPGPAATRRTAPRTAVRAGRVAMTEAVRRSCTGARRSSGHQASGRIWVALRALTPARVGLGRAGGSMPTAAHLAFRADHARARDAVNRAFDGEPSGRDLTAIGRPPSRSSSAAGSRAEYVRRPDLGRHAVGAGADVSVHARR